MWVLAALAVIVAFAMSAFQIDFPGMPKKLFDLDTNITRILNSTNMNKSDAEDVLMKIQSYVFTLGPLTRIMPGDSDVHHVAAVIYQRGPPKFLSVPINNDKIQRTFWWTDNQMKVFNFVYDNAEKHWSDFVKDFEKLNITH